MKKSISAILPVLLVLALALTLFACGKTGNTDETTGDGDMQTTEEVMTEYDVTKDAFELSLYRFKLRVIQGSRRPGADF